jgi:hypothetical protein
MSRIIRSQLKLPPGQAVAYAPPDMGSENFEDGLISSPFFDMYGDGRIGVVNDPTPRASGKVGFCRYILTVPDSTDRDILWQGPAPIRYGVTFWSRAKIFIPAAFNPGDNRKLIDYIGDNTVGGVRMILHRVAASNTRSLRMSAIDWMNGSEQEVMDPDTGIVIPDDTWQTIEVRLTTNSADDVRDAILEIYMNGASTPNFSQTTGLGWITEHKPEGPTQFRQILFGSQLTSSTPPCDEYRYLDDLAISSTRIGP